MFSEIYSCTCEDSTQQCGGNSGVQLAEPINVGLEKRAQSGIPSKDYSGISFYLKNQA